ncbi:MAG: hypothetical protein RL387_1303 [Bacteroidota bacterium]|jgi:hypothetical protein
MRNLEPSLEKLYAYIQDAEISNSSVSSVNIGWHIEHSLLVISRIIDSVTSSDPSKYEYKFDFKRTFVFLLGKFPRGKANAPEIVMPNQNEQVNFDALFASTRVAIKNLESVKPNQYFTHPIFGKLNKQHTFVMLDIHTKHHLKIIEDIISQTL